MYVPKDDAIMIQSKSKRIGMGLGDPSTDLTGKGQWRLRRKERAALFFCLLLLFLFLSAALSELLKTEAGVEFGDEVIRLVNEVRAEAGVAPVVKNTELLAPANLRAEEAATKFSHTRPNGTAWKTVFDEFAIESPYRGENIAWGQPTPERVMRAWMGSKGHRENILDAHFTDMAVGYYVEDDVIYWSQLFIESAGEPVEEPTSSVQIDPSLPLARVSGVNLNLRSEPSTKSSAVEILLDGTQMYVIGEQGSWTQVRLLDGTEGWASTKYLAFE